MSDTFVGMTKTFRPFDLDQTFLLPPDMRSWLPEGHLAMFVADVVGHLDLSAVMDSYRTAHGRGQPPHHPRMMACSAFTRVTACLLAESLKRPFPSKAPAASLPPPPLRLLPAGATVAGRDLSR